MSIALIYIIVVEFGASGGEWQQLGPMHRAGLLL